MTKTKDDKLKAKSKIIAKVKNTEKFKLKTEKRKLGTKKDPKVEILQENVTEIKPRIFKNFFKTEVETKKWFTEGVEQSSNIIELNKRRQLKKEIKRLFSQCGEIANVELFSIANQKVVNNKVDVEKTPTPFISYNCEANSDSEESTTDHDNGTDFKITKEESERTIYVATMNKFDDMEEPIKKLFAQCGEVEHIKIYLRKLKCFAFLRFKDVESAKASLKLNNNIFNDAPIIVKKHNMSVQEESLGKVYVTKLPADTQKEDLQELFSSCGEISSVYVKNPIGDYKSSVAVIIYLKRESAKKAIYLLNRKTFKGVQINVLKYVSTKKSNKAKKTNKFKTKNKTIIKGKNIDNKIEIKNIK